MLKKVIIVLSIIGAIVFMTAFVVSLVTKVPYYFNPLMRERLDNLLPICPTSYSHPLNPTGLEGHENDLYFKQNGYSKTFCTFSPYYFVLMDIFLIILAVVVPLVLTKEIIYVYKTSINGEGLAARVMFDIFVLLVAVPIILVLLYFIKFLITKS